MSYYVTVMATRKVTVHITYGSRLTDLILKSTS